LYPKHVGFRSLPLWRLSADGFNRAAQRGHRRGRRSESRAAAEPPRREHVVEISVNRKPVSVEGPRRTGREIKQAAIEQGVKIESNFVLSEVIGAHKTRVVGDDDEVTVHPGSEFVAVAPDDN